MNNKRTNMTLLATISMGISAYLFIGMLFALFIRDILKTDGGKLLTTWNYVFLVLLWSVMILYLIYDRITYDD